MNELCKYSATELATLIRKGSVSSREVVEAHLSRIETINGETNAITMILADTALAAADEADYCYWFPAEADSAGMTVTLDWYSKTKISHYSN